MATSGSTDYNQTLREAATEALVMVGACMRGDTPSAADMTAALKSANLMVKTWSADPDPKLWLITEASLTLVASTASYTLSAARKVVSARRRTGTGTGQNDLPLRVLSRQEYESRPNKLSTGSPLEVYFDPQQSARTLYVWPVPDATIAASTTIRYTYLRVIEDLDALDNDFDIPQEWVEAILYGLAARLSVSYDLHLINPAKAQKIEERAAALYGQLAAYDDEPGSFFMQPG
jgi:hypothetical protein